VAYKEKLQIGLGHKMHCLYCKKRLWLIFSKDRLFCSKLHEVAYQDAMSAINRLKEFTAPVEPPVGPSTADQKRSHGERESRIPMVWPVGAPPVCNFIVEWSRPKLVATDLAATSVPLEATPFDGPIQFPASNIGLIALTLDSATQPAQEITTIANERFTVCRVQSKRRHRIPLRSPAAFSSRTHRPRIR